MTSDKSKIHSQPGQLREHPNLSGNGSTQAVITQITAAKEKPHQSKIATESPEDDKKQKIHS